MTYQIGQVLYEHGTGDCNRDEITAHPIRKITSAYVWIHEPVTGCTGHPACAERNHRQVRFSRRELEDSGEASNRAHHITVHADFPPLRITVPWTKEKREAVIRENVKRHPRLAPVTRDRCLRGFYGALNVSTGMLTAHSGTDCRPVGKVFGSAPGAPVILHQITSRRVAFKRVPGLVRVKQGDPRECLMAS